MDFHYSSNKPRDIHPVCVQHPSHTFENQSLSVHCIILYLNIINFCELDLKTPCIILCSVTALQHQHNKCTRVSSSPPPTHTHTECSRILTRSLSHTYTLTHMHAHTHTHTYTLSYTLTHSVSFAGICICVTPIVMFQE